MRDVLGYQRFAAHGGDTGSPIALFPKDNPPPRETAERSLNVQQWTEMPRGGYFAALEEPELLVDDMRTFFRRFR